MSRSAHRARSSWVFSKSPVVDAHELVVLQAGRVVERGPLAKLLALRGRHAEMWRPQHSGDVAAVGER